MDFLQKYFDESAKKMRSSGVNKFKGKFKAYRRVITPKMLYKNVSKL